MASHAEDCGQVLEQFIHDAANLPAEITHLMEEIGSKDRTVEEHRLKIANLDNSLQKFIRQNGFNAPNPKEDAYRRTIEDLYAKCKTLAAEKVMLAERAAVVLDRQVKKLDIKIDQMEKDGVMQNDPPLPSLLRNKGTFQKTPFPDLTAATVAAAAEAAGPLQSTSGNHGVGQRLTQSLARALQNGASGGSAGSRVSTPTTPTGGAAAAAALHLQRNQREPSAGANDNKRRRLNASLGSLPAASSNLRQSSLGPGTPKAGTPGATRAGSAGPRGTAGQVKKPTSKKVAPHQQVRRLKAGTASAGTASNTASSGNKQTKRSSSAAARVKAGGGSGYRKSPANSTAAAAAAGSGGAGGGDEDDSVLSSADLSDSSQVAREDEEIPEEDEDDEEDGGEDSRLYCTCQTVSHGDMVACDNTECSYEWFHWKCVGLTKEPSGTWYCPECRKTMS